MVNLVVDYSVCIIPIGETIELLEYKLESLKVARDEDCSWNYGIEELEEINSKLL
jgi:hypothetical protein